MPKYYVRAKGVRYTVDAACPHESAVKVVRRCMERRIPLNHRDYFRINEVGFRPNARDVHIDIGVSADAARMWIKAEQEKKRKGK